MHQLLTEMRKRHDEVKTITNGKKNQIEADKKLLEELRGEEAQLDAAIKGAKKVRNGLLRNYRTPRKSYGGSSRVTTTQHIRGTST